MRSHQDEIVVLLNSISLGFIAGAKSEVRRCKNPDSAFNVKQALTLKSDRAEIVEDVHPVCWVVIKVVAKRGRELCDLAAVRSRPVICCAGQVNPRADNSHISHWPNSDLVVAPAIGVHHAKVAEPKIGGCIQICNVSLAAECKASAERGITIPSGLRVLAEEFMSTVFCPVGISQ